MLGESLKEDHLDVKVVLYNNEAIILPIDPRRYTQQVKDISASNLTNFAAAFFCIQKILTEANSKTNFDAINAFSCTSYSSHCCFLVNAHTIYLLAMFVYYLNKFVITLSEIRVMQQRIMFVSENTIRPSQATIMFLTDGDDTCNGSGLKVKLEEFQRKMKSYSFPVTIHAVGFSGSRSISQNIEHIGVIVTSTCT